MGEAIGVADNPASGLLCIAGMPMTGVRVGSWVWEPVPLILLVLIGTRRKGLGDSGGLLTQHNLGVLKAALRVRTADCMRVFCSSGSFMRYRALGEIYVKEGTGSGESIYDKPVWMTRGGSLSENGLTALS